MQTPKVSDLDNSINRFFATRSCNVNDHSERCEMETTIDDDTIYCCASATMGFNPKVYFEQTAERENIIK